MKTQRLRSLLPALLCAAALATLGCGHEQSGEVAAERTPSSEVAQNAAPQHELQPESRTVEIEEPSAVAGGEERAEVEARERELAAREEEIAARERLLRERERQARVEEARPAPRPVPRPAEPPAPVPAAEEPEPALEPVPEPVDEAPFEAEEPAEEPMEEPEEAPRTVSVTIPAGTVMDVEFTERVASNTSAPGDTFRVRIANDIREDGVVAIPRGSEIVGVVTEAVPLRRVGGRARLSLKLTDLVLPSGSTVPIDASFVRTGRNETGRDAATIGGGAAGGAILGRVLGKGDRSKGSVIGAIIGAAAGAVIAARTPGEEVVFPAGTVVSLKLDDSVEVRARAGG